ncbi:IS110 family transposase [Phyllobacterium sp. 628]|uniref:IS110 family transposase n=1 Tax=Phyllobacterium sp. 628 TaxID=2718938 RepID=UPI0016627C1E|nr:IS110 family transposase [Phyllobacterium sp. 628]QND50789.1 IS110 family transposase [Phyllobacterium sp. 628]QND53353.1 IS110 family transposase [Phyllobacterium sp. 628]QND53546.1 IS110 family transposase [Phyllobacterium sp. 628]QND53579.1 IS110 family transposase [Phyllobacterium sp. 628]
MTQFTRFVGIDVSKAYLDLHCLPDGLELRVPNSRAGVGLLLQRIGVLEGVAFGCEATGGYEDCLLIVLGEAGMAAYCLHPSDVRSHSRLTGRRAKTDRLDAIAIARALQVAVATRKPAIRSTTMSAIKELTTLRRRLIAGLSELKSHEARMGDADAASIIGVLMDQHIKAIKTLEAHIRSAIARNPAQAQTARRIASMPGAGPVLTAELIGSMPELGTLSSRQAASLTGVAPHPRQSGNSSRSGKCQGGRAGIRRVLYMASLSVIRCAKHPLAAFYQRLRANGKPFKLAIVALMRKLIVTLNAMIKNQTDWQPNIQT